MKTDSLYFLVREGYEKDNGRPVCRIAPDVIKKNNWELGQVILLAGQKSVPVRVMPLYPEDRGEDIVKVNSVIRYNAGVSVGDKITIRSVNASPARKVVLLPAKEISSGISYKDGAIQNVLTEGMPLQKGQVIYADYKGFKGNAFTVMSVIPESVVTITTETKIQIQSDVTKANKPSKITYDDIGGLGSQLQRIREMIELPLKYPEVFDRLGIEPPKGVLLYGPPGTGKTMIARAVANETDAYFITVSGPEIMGKFYGESEGRLRKIFEEAKSHAPAIIFMDEIDAIAPKREEMGGEKQVERRVVAQLLALMDGLNSRGQVIVIAATNLPDTIDPALRRPGRFDREIAIPVPDKYGRHEILLSHSRCMPLSDDVDINKLSEITHGYVGADLQSFCREAAMSALRGMMHNINFSEKKVPYELLMSMNVTMSDFMRAFKDVEPSAIRDVFVEIPNVSWGDVGGHAEIKNELREAVEWPLKYSKLYDMTSTVPPKGILLYGPPGTGKTLIAKAVANECGANFIAVKGAKLMSQYIGEAEKGVSEVFRKARQAEPTVLFIDEIESLLPKRHMGGEGAGVVDRVISQFLIEMDGIEELNGVVVLAASNRIDMIDDALLRSGRFELHIEIPYPDREGRVEIFNIHIKSKPVASDVNVGILADMTEGMSGADIEYICRRAGIIMIREYVQDVDQLHEYEEGIINPDVSIDLACFRKAIGDLYAMKEKSINK